MNKSIINRFFTKVDKTDNCWLWAASLNRQGYGQFSINNKPQRAHRVAWIIHNGEIPEGLHVLHKCNNPPCVNPEHLYVGTHTDNMRDLVNAGNKIPARGTCNGKSKLTESDIHDIRRLHGNIMTIAIAKMFRVHKTTITNIINKKTWGHIKEVP